MTGQWLRRLGDRVQRARYRTPPKALRKIRQAESSSATELDLRALQLKTVPEGLLRLSNLTTLDLSINGLTELPEHLSRLENLTSLNLGGNQLTELPEWLIEMPGFSKLEVQKSLLRDNTGTLNVADNNISSPPGEVLDQGLDAVKEYFRQLREEGTDQLYEAKLLIVGEPEAGKTTLAKKIKNPNYQLSPLPSTEGIDVLHWDFPHTNGATFRVNIWDFGGQEIYKETHQFFLTRRSCYVLVADNRKEDDNLYYWLNIIETLADGSPILIVKNEKGD